MMIDEDYKNVSVFAIETQSKDESTSDRQSYTRRWIYEACPLYILPRFNVYRYANDRGSRVLQLYASQPIIYSANESLNAISSDRILLFTFLLMAQKLYLNRLQGTEEIKFI